MRPGRSALLAVFALAGLAFAFALQTGLNYRGYSPEENDPSEIPPDAFEKTEWAFARLRYPAFGGFGGYRRSYSWAIDYPKADRQFVQGVRRLTRLHARSMETVIDPGSDEIYDWPWVYAVEVGHWELTDAQAAKLRDYLMRGGFLMVDDFHGTREWAVFLASMQRIFPDRPIVDVPSSDEIFHVLYDLDERYQVPGVQFLRSGRTFERDGYQAGWKAIYDDKGRVMVAICHNMDLGDAWEWADEPQYPAKYTTLAYRVGINYIIYAMSH